MDSANAASAASPRNNGSLAQRVLSAALLLPLLVVSGLVERLECRGHCRHGDGGRPDRAVWRVQTGRLSPADGWLASAARSRLFWRSAFQPTVAFDLLLPVVTFVIVVSLVAELAYPHQPGSLPSWGLTLAGAFYIAWLFSHFILLRSLERAGTARYDLQAAGHAAGGRVDLLCVRDHLAPGYSRPISSGAGSAGTSWRRFLAQRRPGRARPAA